MTTALTEVEEKIRSLSDAEKRQLLAQLIAELGDDVDEPADLEVEAEWLAEAERRRKELLEGKVQAIPAEQVFAEVRASLRR